MKNFLYTNRRIAAALVGVILIVIGGTYYLKHLESERTVEAERNMQIDFPQWHLPENATARIGMGTVTAMHYSPDGTQLAVVSNIGVWLLKPDTLEPLHLLGAHTGVVNSISFSRDGRTLAIGTKNGTAQLWDTSTGEHKETFTYRDYFFGVDKVFLMTDDQTLAVIYANSSLDLWDINTGELKKPPTTTAENNSDTKVRNSPYTYMNLEGYDCTFSADGKTIASQSSDSDTFRFWDITTRKETRTLKAERSSRYRELVSFSSDLQKVAIASQFEKHHWRKPFPQQVWSINLWDVNSQTQQKIAESDDFIGVRFLVFSPDGNLIASYIKDTIRIWDVNTGKEVKRLRGNSGGVNAVAFSPDNRTLVSHGWDDSLRVWDIKTGKEKKITGGYGSFYSDVKLSDDVQKLMTLKAGSRSIRIWDPNTGKHDKTFIGTKKYVWDVDLTHDGGKLASRSAFNKTIHLWDVDTGKHSKLQGANRNVNGIAFSQDGEMLSSWGSAGKGKDVVHLWDSETGQIKRTLYLSEPDNLAAWAADAYFDDEMFATIEIATPDLFVWNLVTGDYKTTICGDKMISVARFSPDGELLATVMDNEIVLWAVKTGNQIGTLIGHKYDVQIIAFSPDSKTLASGGEFRDKTMRLWDIETGSSRVVMDPDWEFRQYKFEATVASTFAFSSDGQTLASGMKSGIIYLWETATGEIKQILRGHSDQVSHLFFSPDVKTLISASSDGSILIWDLTGNSN